MARQNTMTFSRDVNTGPACVQYSWVPDGQRKEIKLLPQQDQDSRSDSVSDNISQVQVYCLVCNELGIHAPNTWQFPPGPPYRSPVISAAIQVFESGKYVAGTVNYADGTSTSDTYPLTPHPLPCPKLPEH
jgi:hypothetical protein